MYLGMTIEKKGQFWVTQHVFGQNENRMASIPSEHASPPQTRGRRMQSNCDSQIKDFKCNILLDTYHYNFHVLLSLKKKLQSVEQKNVILFITPLIMIVH